MKFWLRSYFILSSQHSQHNGGLFNESWSVRSAPFWTRPVRVAANYITEKEKELGGTTFIKEFRRI